jgi:hypothetical protein
MRPDESGDQFARHYAELGRPKRHTPLNSDVHSGFCFRQFLCTARRMHSVAVVAFAYSW